MSQPTENQGHREEGKRPEPLPWSWQGILVFVANHFGVVAAVGFAFWLGGLSTLVAVQGVSISRLHDAQAEGLKSLKTDLLRDIGKIEAEHKSLNDFLRTGRWVRVTSATNVHEGTIDQIDRDNKTLTVKPLDPGQGTQAFPVAPGWKCIYKTKQVTLADLKPGLFVRVTTDADGKAEIVNAYDTLADMLKNPG